jgi:phosphoribosylamine-glycine ligase
MSTMTRQILAIARTEALALATVSRNEPLDRAAADKAIRASIRTHGGTRGCAAALAEAYGDYPETTCPRIRWARLTVTALYDGAA